MTAMKTGLVHNDGALRPLRRQRNSDHTNLCGGRRGRARRQLQVHRNGSLDSNIGPLAGRKTRCGDAPGENIQGNDYQLRQVIGCRHEEDELLIMRKDSNQRVDTLSQSPVNNSGGFGQKGRATGAAPASHRR
jgi:hypothetical protein